MDAGVQIISRPLHRIIPISNNNTCQIKAIPKSQHVFLFANLESCRTEELDNEVELDQVMREGDFDLPGPAGKVELPSLPSQNSLTKMYTILGVQEKGFHFPTSQLTSQDAPGSDDIKFD